ncbi:hypothetical protein Tco_0090328 [Tanacetum coccineum]
MSETNESGSTVNEYLTTIRNDNGPGIVRPLFEENIKFEFWGQCIEELKENMLYEKENEDPHEHISNITRIIDLFHSPGIARNQELLEKAFLEEYCPPLKIIKQIESIRNFKQKLNEPLHYSWERFTNSLFDYPEHKLNKHEKLQIFYQGLDKETRRKVDFKGPIPRMTPTNGMEVIKELSAHSISWYEEGNVKTEDKAFQVVLNQINKFKNNINNITEEVRMAQHKYETPMEGRFSNLKETLNKFIKESRIRQKESESIV